MTYWLPPLALLLFLFGIGPSCHSNLYVSLHGFSFPPILIHKLSFLSTCTNLLFIIIPELVCTVIASAEVKNKMPLPGPSAVCGDHAKASTLFSTFCLIPLGTRPDLRACFTRLPCHAILGACRTDRESFQNASTPIISLGPHVTPAEKQVTSVSSIHRQEN